MHFAENAEAAFKTMSKPTIVAMVPEPGPLDRSKMAKMKLQSFVQGDPRLGPAGSTRSALGGSNCIRHARTPSTHGFRMARRRVA